MADYLESVLSGKRLDYTRPAPFVADPPAEPFTPLAELRYYQAHYLLNESNAQSGYIALVGDSTAATFAADSEAERQQALFKILPPR